MVASLSQISRSPAFSWGSSSLKRQASFAFTLLGAELSCSIIRNLRVIESTPQKLAV